MRKIDELGVGRRRKQKEKVERPKDKTKGSKTIKATPAPIHKRKETETKPRSVCYLLYEPTELSFQTVRLKALKFTSSTSTPDLMIPETIPEVAFIGRSNVGKSSLINALNEGRHVARVSGLYSPDYSN